MALGVTDLKKGTLFVWEGTPYKVVEYAQKVMGRGGSIVNVKIKSLTDGKVLSKTFKGNESLEPADVSNQTVQYLYNDGSNYFFMEPSTYEQFEVPATVVGDQNGYLKEGENVTIQLFNDRIINIELPKSVYLEVTYAEDVVKGDTTNAVTKDAQLETGIKVRVPAFIKTGDVIFLTRSSALLRSTSSPG